MGRAAFASQSPCQGTEKPLTIGRGVNVPDRSPGPQDVLVMREMSAALRARLELVLKSLPPLEREALRLGYGLDGESRSWREVAAIMQLTESEVCDAVSQGLARMHKPVRMQMLRDAL